MANLLIERLGQPPFTWGAVNLVKQGATRDDYIAALRATDGGDFVPLFLFARS